MQALTEESFALGYDLEIGGTVYRQSWVGMVDAPIDRVRALAFTADGEMLLVCGDVGLQLPGGGVEAGESAMQALHRELWEEAAATIEAEVRMGAIQIDVHGDQRCEFHDFYCCRITLTDDWAPTDEISRRVTVPPDGFLDALHYGRSDPKAAFLLDRALQTIVALR